MYITYRTEPPKFFFSFSRSGRVLFVRMFEIVTIVTGCLFRWYLTLLYIVLEGETTETTKNETRDLINLYLLWNERAKMYTRVPERCISGARGR